MKKIAITGIGMITPHGDNKEIIWDGILNKQLKISAIDKFNAENYTIRHAGIIKSDLSQYFPARVSKKLDRFTQLAMIAANEAIEDARIHDDNFDKSRIGVYVGNCLGGWEFTDKELRGLYTEGAETLSPYLATAWFPAAPQGEITIAHGFKGQSKTFDSGETSGLVTISYAADAIRQGKLDVVIAGGVEAPINPFMLCALQSVGNNIWSNTNEYSPFSNPSSGRLPAEASAFVVLESVESALKRQAKIYATVDSMGQAFCSQGSKYKNVEQFALYRAMQSAMTKSTMVPAEISLIFADGASSRIPDLQELAAIESFFSRYQIPITTPKTWFGHSIAASGALDIGLAALSLREQTILPSHVNESNANYLVTDMLKKSLNKIMVNSSSTKGMAVSLILSRVN